jgi:hypothetical protein
MSLLLSVANRGNYAPWQRPPLRSDARVRSQSRCLPANVLTCWELNFVSDENHLKPAHTIPSCGGCSLFEGDKSLYGHLRKLDTNKEAPYRYRCLTPWVESSFAPPSIPKRKPEDPPAVLSPTGNATPSKKRKSSPRVLHDVAHIPVSPAVAAPHTKTPPFASLAERGPPDDPSEAQSLTTWLMARLATSEQATDTLKADILLLEQEKTQFYNKTEAELKVLNAEWTERLSESQKQVVYCALLPRNLPL